MPKNYGHLQVRANDRHVWVDTPTIQKLRIVLDDLIEAGVADDAPLMISQIANSPSVFAVRELNAPVTTPEEIERWITQTARD